MSPLLVEALIGTAILSYLIGSIPFGLILTRLGGAGDIRAIGSGNIGATNVLRTGRKGLAAATLVLDGLKGFAGPMLCAVAWPFFAPAVIALGAVCAVLGHCFPAWLRFRGGKGVATGLGAAFALDWRAGLICCLVWLLVARLSKISSAGALAAFLALPALLLLFAFGQTGAPNLWAGLLIAAIVFVRHRGNIARLLNGTEPRIGKKA
ncbi:glycerol-3-phosphate 1-O-acyltransferase PlsY [Acetobacteraceae bacterium KSS8]|uniref:Glycerol-3-phosphate acyltransferase n=1 Tax=Endosaccharibacter trunci TaxID=2812733 RepID=A0ABT1WAR3_9PROT|nr:glycerol-3-phosphate 1-O-acyltransferase PlsY [Acetobacteraceae bacterium KSS8]